MVFVDDHACARCHEAAYREWSGSHHDQAMQPADEKTVLGDFNDARITHFGVTSRFFKRGGKFFVNTEGPDGKPADFEIKHTFGVDPLQQYLVEFPGGRLQSLTIAWDTVKRRWFSLYPDEKILPGDSLHWTGRYQNWNLMCAECHATNLNRGYDDATDSYRTTWTALNVGCQACHGPGHAHLAWAEALRAGKRVDKDDDGLLVKGKGATSRDQVDNCARCHSRRTRLDTNERPGHPFLDEFRTEPLQGRTLPSGRPDPGGGVRVRVLPPEQDVSAGRAVHRLPQPAHRESARRRATRSAPGATGRRPTRVSPRREPRSTMGSRIISIRQDRPALCVSTVTCRPRTT